VNKSPREILKDLEETIQGFSLEIESLQQHVGSTGEFILISIKHLVNALRELKPLLEKEITKNGNHE
jgi:hypothetical protein